MRKLKLKLTSFQVGILAQTLPDVMTSAIGNCEKLALVEWHEKNAGRLQYEKDGFKATLMLSQGYAMAVFLGSLDDLGDSMFYIERGDIINNIGRQLPKTVFQK